MKTTPIRLASISVPDRLQRNDPAIVKAGVETGGVELLRIVARRLKRADLSGIRLLDVGCGVRFTQTIINRSIPIGSYTGIEVYRPVVDWLTENVEGQDDRFHFVHWDAYSFCYNNTPAARPMSELSAFPVSGRFDLITGFSLFTHLNSDDAEQMLRLMRKVANPDGHLFFSALCQDKTVATFKEMKPDRPSAEVRYAKSYLEKLVRNNGWEIVSHGEPSFFIVDSFLCRAV